MTFEKRKGYTMLKLVIIEYVQPGRAWVLEITTEEAEALKSDPELLDGFIARGDSIPPWEAEEMDADLFEVIS